MQPTHDLTSPCPLVVDASICGLLLHWQLQLGACSVLLLFFFSRLHCPLRLQNSPQTSLWEGFLLSGNFSFFRTPSLTLLSLFLSFMFCPTSFWWKWAAFLGAWYPLPAFRNCFVKVAQHSNDLLMNFWGEKVVFLSYSSTILGPPHPLTFKIDQMQFW